MRSGQSGGNSIPFFLGLASLIRPGGGANALARRREFRPGIQGLESRVVLSRTLEIPSPAAPGAAERADAEDLGAARHDRDRPGAPPAGGASRLPRFATVRGAFTWTKGGKNWGLRPHPRAAAGWAYNPKQLATFDGEGAIKAVGALDFSKLRFNGDLAVIPAGGDAALIGVGRPSGLAARPGRTATIAVPISSEAGLVINDGMADAGTVILAGANRPFQLLRIDGGTLRVSRPENLGLGDPAASGLVVMGNPSTGRPSRPAFQVVGNALINYGERQSFQLLARDSIFDVESGSKLTIEGVISGNGGLTKRGGGTLYLGGAEPNRFAGPVVVEGGTLRLGKITYWDQPQSYAISGPGSLTIKNSGTVILDRYNPFFQDAVSLTIDAGGVLDVNKSGYTGVRDLVVNGVLSGIVESNYVRAYTLNGGPGSLILGSGILLINPDPSSPTTMEFAGQIKSSGMFWMMIPNRSLVLSGQDLYQDRFRLTVGTLFLNGSLDGEMLIVDPHAASEYEAVLGGIGVIGSATTIQGDGVVAPGAAAGAPGILTLGDLAMENDARLRIDLRGPADGTGHDKLVVNGRLEMDPGVKLELIGGFVPTSAEPITILEHNGEGEIAPFARLPEGAPVYVGPSTWTISYRGGPEGRDVVLIPAPRE